MPCWTNYARKLMHAEQVNASRDCTLISSMVGHRFPLVHVRLSRSTTCGPSEIAEVVSRPAGGRVLVGKHVTASALQRALSPRVVSRDIQVNSPDGGLRSTFNGLAVGSVPLVVRTTLGNEAHGDVLEAAGGSTRRARRRSEAATSAPHRRDQRRWAPRPSSAHLAYCFFSHSNLTPSRSSDVSIWVIAACVSPPSCVVSGSSIARIGRFWTTAR